MAADTAPTETLIAERYAVDPSRRLPDTGGGVPAFAAIDRKFGDARLAALAVGRHASPRLAAIEALTAPIDNLMVPLGHGVGPRQGGGQAYYVICSAPPGPSLSAPFSPWSEAAILESVLRPAAEVLVALEAAGITHRAIRPDNVFAGTRNQPVTLGAAWAAPPAMHQPALFEPPFCAICHPAGRGNGTILDDVYALGVLLVVLATGQVPLAGLDDAGMIRRKLGFGSYTALTDGAAIPVFLADLLRGMLADEPEHRPVPRMLTDLSNARLRRIASRPPRRSQRPLMVNDIPVYDARMLAYAFTTDESKTLQALRTGAATQWLRRGLGDAGLASQIEDLMRVRSAVSRPPPEADSRLIMHVISAIEPRMPLCWRDLALWPDAIPSLLADGMRGNPKLMMQIEELLRDDVLSTWGAGEGGASGDVLAASPEGRQLRMFLQKGGENAMLRIFYALNPVLPYSAPAAGDAWIIGMADLLRFLEKSIAPGSGPTLIDSPMRAFITARGDRQLEAAVNLMIVTREPRASRMRQIGVLRDLQQRHLPEPLPALTAWAANQLRPELDVWRNRRKRAAVAERLEASVKAGFVGHLLALLEDDTARRQDEEGAERAAMLVAAIDAELAAIDRSDAMRQAATARFGREMAAALGMMALIVMALLAVFG